MSAARKEVASTFYVNAPCQRVWSLIRRFGEVAEWNPFIARSSVVHGEDGFVGADREVITADGTVVRERLEELDNVRCSLGYRMLTFPLPVIYQANRIVVSPTGDAGESRITFSAVFEPAAGAHEEEIASANEKAFSAAALGIGRHLEAQVIVADRPRGS